ncbi:MAG TPA: tocopherol cyclase family protein, partial [Bacteroidales bacterium]|nr:tocopherol cyclase family protein [Bacteroidales bacterium]
DAVKLPSRRLLNAGIMGWYRFVPFMQCYHGVVSLSHHLEGVLVKDGVKHNFGDGRGYIEKDWGSSMPSAWIWMQSNNFGNQEVSFMLSVANIPWMGKSFTGFLGFCYFNGTIHRFATYTRARLEIRNQGLDTLQIVIRDRKLVYEIRAIRHNSGLLKAPVKGAMDRRIPESIDARLHLDIWDLRGNLIFSDSTSIAGLEIVGDQQLLMSKIGR